MQIFLCNVFSLMSSRNDNKYLGGRKWLPEFVKRLREASEGERNLTIRVQCEKGTKCTIMKLKGIVSRLKCQKGSIFKLISLKFLLQKHLQIELSTNNLRVDIQTTILCFWLLQWEASTGVSLTDWCKSNFTLTRVYRISCAFV